MNALPPFAVPADTIGRQPLVEVFRGLGNMCDNIYTVSLPEAVVRDGQKMP